MKEKLGRLWIILLIPVLLLAGCGKKKEVIPEDLLAEVVANQAQLKTGKVHMTMDFDADITMSVLGEQPGYEEGTPVNMSMHMDMNMEFQEDKARTKGTFDMSMMSIETSTSFESYTVTSGDHVINYLNDGSKWTKSESTADTASVGAMVFSGADLYKKVENNSLSMTEENLEDGELPCYVIHSEIDGDVVNGLVDATVASADQEDLLDDMDFSQEKVGIDLYVDKEKKQIAQVKLDMSQFAAKAVRETVGDMTGTGAEVHKYEVQATITEQGEAVDIQLPEAAEAL